MHFRDIIRTRRMIRRFTSEPVADEVVDRIIDAGNRGPSAGFSQGVSFISIASEETRREVAAVCGEQGYIAAGFGPFVSQAPVQIVICTSEAVYRERYAQPDKRRAAARDPMFPVPYWYTDAGAAMMLILLAAVDEGLGSAFVGIHDQPGMRDLLGIPAEVTPVGVVLVGHPATDKRSRSLKRGRNPIDEVHHRERW
ncbi:MAG TPA: nitroreductase family protein [Thermomicrobiales bacterium]|nr:nitroreductase family protein [Thermomicrobiales bacterium]